MNISRSLSHIVNPLKRITYSWMNVLKYFIKVTGLFITKSQCVVNLWLLHECLSEILVWDGPSVNWEPFKPSEPSEYTSGKVLRICDRNSTMLMLSVQSSASICLCGWHGLIGWGRRWAQHKLKIMEHFAPKESEGKKYNGRARERSAGWKRCHMSARDCGSFGTVTAQHTHI